MKIAVCDDNRDILDEVSLCIKKYAEQRKNTELSFFAFESAGELNDAIDSGELFDIYLLDVYIGDDIGTELARNIRKRGIESPIMFLTTSLDHAPESFETGTLRYLLKPLDAGKLYEALDAAVEKAVKIGAEFIKLKTENGIENINAGNIMYTESRSHYQYVNYISGERVRTRMTVAELYDKLSQFSGFVRCGSSYIINLKKVKSVSTTEVYFIDNTKIFLPRGSHNELKEAFWLLQYEVQED